jgi:hypothetical protein
MNMKRPWQSLWKCSVFTILVFINIIGFIYRNDKDIENNSTKYTYKKIFIILPDGKTIYIKVEKYARLKTNGIRFGEAEKPGPNTNINYKMTRKKSNCTRIGYWNTRRKITKGLITWETKIAAWEFDVITFAEIFIDQPTANTLNGFNNSETYLRKASSDNKYNGTQGPSLITYVNRYMGFNKYFKVVMNGYIHAIDIPEKKLIKRRLILHVYIPPATPKRIPKIRGIISKIKEYTNMAKEQDFELIIQGDINQTYEEDQRSSRKGNREFSKANNDLNLFNNLHSFSDLAAQRETSTKKRATFNNGNSWSCIDITFTTKLFTDTCENYIIDKYNSFGRRSQQQKINSKPVTETESVTVEKKSNDNIQENALTLPEWMKNIDIDLDTVEIEETITVTEKGGRWVAEDGTYTFDIDKPNAIWYDREDVQINQLHQNENKLDHCLIAADFNTIKLLNWDWHFAHTPKDRTKLDLENLHNDYSKIDAKYNEENFILMCEQTKRRLTSQDTPKEARIACLNWYADRLQQFHKETLTDYQSETNFEDRQEIISKKHELERKRADKYTTGNDQIRTKIEKQEEEKNKLEELIKSFNIAEAKKQKVIGAMTGSWGRTANAITTDGRKPMVDFIKTFENGHFRIANTKQEILAQARHDHLCWTKSILKSHEQLSEDKDATNNISIFSNIKEYEDKMKEITNQQAYKDELKKITTESFTPEELTHAFNRVKLGTAAGPSGIPPEYYRLYGVQTALKILYDGILKLQTIPDCWRKTYKWCVVKDKEKPMGIHNARPISLLEVEFKIFETLIKTRLTTVLTRYNILCKAQHGFLDGHSTTAPIFDLHTACRDAHHNNETLHIALLDMSKAFDSPERFAMESIYNWHRFPSTLTNLLKDMDKNITSCILTPGHGMTAPYKIERGCPQGSVISPLKWDLFLNPVLHVITDNHKGYKFHHSDHTISCRCFADDTALLAPNRDSLVKMFRTFASYCGMNGVSINAKKTVVYNINDIVQAPFKVRTLHKCWRHLDGNKKYEEKQKICSCSLEGEFRIQTDNIHYENVMEWDPNKQYKEGDKVYIQKGSKTSDTQFIATKDITAEEASILPCVYTAEGTKTSWDALRYRYLGVYFDFQDNVSATQFYIEQKLERFFKKFQKRSFAPMESHLVIVNIFEKIFEYSCGHVPLPLETLLRYDELMYAEISLKLKVPLKVIKSSKLIHGAFEYGGLQIPSFVTLQVSAQSRIVNRILANPTIQPYASLVEQINEIIRLKGSIKGADSLESMKRYNNIASLIVGARHLGLEVWSSLDRWTESDSDKALASNLGAFLRTKRIEVTARNHLNDPANWQQIVREGGVQLETNSQLKQFKTTQIDEQEAIHRISEDTETYAPIPPSDTAHLDNTNGYLRVGTDGSLTEDERGSYMGAAIVVDANPSVNQALQLEQIRGQHSVPTEVTFVAPRKDCMTARNFKPREQAHAKLQNYTAPPAHPVYVKRLIFNARADDISSTTAEHIALNEALFIMHNMVIYTDSAVALERIQQVQKRVDQLSQRFIDTYQFPQHILQQGTDSTEQNTSGWVETSVTLYKTQPAFTETLLLSQISYEILCLRRKAQLNSHILKCRSHGKGFVVGASDNQLPSVTHINQRADYWCQTQQLTTDEKLTFSARRCTTRILYLTLEGEELLDATRFVIKLERSVANHKLQNYKRPALAALHKHTCVQPPRFRRLPAEVQRFCILWYNGLLKTKTRYSHGSGNTKCLAEGCTCTYANQKHFETDTCTSNIDVKAIWPYKLVNYIFSQAPRGWPILPSQEIQYTSEEGIPMKIQSGWTNRSFLEAFNQLAQQLSLEHLLAAELSNHTRTRNCNLKYKVQNKHTLAWVRSNSKLYRITAHEDYNRENNFQWETILLIATTYTDVIVKPNSAKIDDMHASALLMDPRWLLLNSFHDWYHQRPTHHQYFRVNIPENYNTFMWDNTHLKNANKFISAMKHINSFEGLRAGGYYTGVPKNPDDPTHIHTYNNLSWHKIFLGLYDKWDWKLNTYNIPDEAMTQLNLRPRETNMHTITVTYRKFSIDHGELYAIFYLQEYVHRSWLRFAKLTQKHPTAKQKKTLRRHTIERHKTRQRLTTLAAHNHVCKFENCKLPVWQKRQQSYRYCKYHLDGGSAFFQKCPGFEYIQDNLDHGPYVELMTYYVSVQPALPICKYGNLSPEDLRYQVLPCDSPCNDKKKLCQYHLQQIKNEGLQLCRTKHCLSIIKSNNTIPRTHKKCPHHCNQD